MERDLYRIMKEIQEKEQAYNVQNGKYMVKDVEYVGKIKTVEKVNDLDVEVEKDIFKVTEKMEDGTTIESYYDEKGEFLAGKAKDGKLYPSEKFTIRDKNVLAKLDEIGKKPGLSINEIENEIEEISKMLGMKKEEILTISKVDLEQKIEQKEQDKDKIDLDEKKQDVKEQNINALKNISKKQEIQLDRKVDDIHTLGDVLGVDSSSKLIAVYSDDIKNNDNNTRFSFIIKNADGSLENAKMLDQVGGIHSDKNVYEVNRDGSDVSKENVQSSYKINSKIVENGILTARIGEMEYIEIAYGQTDRSAHKEALTQNLETERTYYTTYRVREEFSKKKGRDNIKDDLNEIKEHEKYGCKDLSLEEADGDPDTGHKHIEITEEMIKKVKEESPNIEDVYSDAEIKEEIEKEFEKNPEEDIEKQIERVADNLEDYAKHIPTHNRENPNN